MDLDSCVRPVYGDQKEGTDFTYKGSFGYHPLVISLAGTLECLRLINRPGNEAFGRRIRDASTRAVPDARSALQAGDRAGRLGVLQASDLRCVRGSWTLLRRGVAPATELREPVRGPSGRAVEAVPAAGREPEGARASGANAGPTDVEERARSAQQARPAAQEAVDRRDPLPAGAQRPDPIG